MHIADDARVSITGTWFEAKHKPIGCGGCEPSPIPEDTCPATPFSYWLHMGHRPISRVSALFGCVAIIVISNLSLGFGGAFLECFRLGRAGRVRDKSGTVRRDKVRTLFDLVGCSSGSVLVTVALRLG